MLISAYCTLSPEGFNLTAGGRRSNRHPDTNRKISDSVTKLWQRPEHRRAVSVSIQNAWRQGKYHTVSMFDEHGVIIGQSIITGARKCYRSYSELKADGFNTGNVWLCLHGQRQTCNKYRWRYRDGDFLTARARAIRISPKRRAVIGTSLDGQHIIMYRFIRQGIQDGFLSGSICNAIKSGRLYKGYIWQYA